MSEPWFVRRRGRGYYRVDPVGAPGWWLTIGYSLASILLSLALLGRHSGPGARDWLAWAVALAAITAGYCVTVWRMSAPEGRCGKP